MSVLKEFIQEVEGMASAELGSNVVSFRDARAKRIKELAEQWAENTIQLGSELRAVRDTFPVSNANNPKSPRPGWYAWIKENFDFHPDHAAKLIRISERAKVIVPGGTIAGSAKLLSFLFQSTTPDSVREEVNERIESGERIGEGIAKKIKEKHTAPPPEEARKIARDTGKPTLARDGNIYLGATKEQERHIEVRREMVFGVRHAIEALATVQIDPKQFLRQALPHQLWTIEEEHLIGEALDWLSSLAVEWERR